jgi:hypothetical protein
MAGKVAPALLGMEEIVAEEDSFEDWFDFRTTILASAFLRTKMLHEEVARPSTTERAACPRSEEALFQQRLRESDRKILMNPVSKLIAKKKTAKNHPASSDFKLIFSLTNKYSLWVKATYVRLPGYIATAYPT